MKLLLIGGHGQLGTEIRKALAKRPGISVHAPQRSGLDITVPVDLDNWLTPDSAWDTVINCAAFHKVEACEADPAMSFAANAQGPYRMAQACARIGAHLIHVSTDYVFGGSRSNRYLLTEQHPPAPLNVYGASKLAGESLIASTGCSATIVRVASLFGHAGASGKGGNFIETMIRKAKAAEPISVVSDIWMSPTHAGDVAEAIATLAENSITGTYHAVNRGAASWLMLARFALGEAGFRDYPVTGHISADRPQPVQRPSWSALSCTKLEEDGVLSMRSWQEAVIDYVRHRPGA